MTIRLDPKTRFILDFIARAKGQNITTVVERAIVEAANRLSLGDDQDTKWQNLWSINEGVRSVNIARQVELFPTYEEESMLAFVRFHWPFFYSDFGLHHPRPVFMDVLWPNISEYIKDWIDKKTSSYFATGRKMAHALRAAGVEPPVWPIGSKPIPQSLPAPTASRMSEIEDDDIPF